MRAGFAVSGDVQFLPGYCVLTTDDPGADLPRAVRPAFLADMDPLGEAVPGASAASSAQPEHDGLRVEPAGMLTSLGS